MNDLDTVAPVFGRAMGTKGHSNTGHYSRIWRFLAFKVFLRRSHIPIESDIPRESEAIKMPTVERIRELCARVVEAKNPQEFDLLLLELANALSTYNDIQVSDKAAEA